MASGIKQELIFVNGLESSPPLFESQDLFEGELTSQDDTSRFALNGRRDPMLNQGVALGMPTTNWATPAASNSNSQNLPDLGQLLGSGGLTESDLETFPFPQLSDSEATLSQVLANSDLLNAGRLMDTTSTKVETTVAQRTTTISIASNAIAAATTSDYRLTTTAAAAVVGDAVSARDKIFKDEVITLEDWKGGFNFQVTPIMDATLVKKSIYYLKKDNKLFCKSGVAVPLKIELDFTKIKVPEDYFVRTSIVYTDPNDISKAVLRCSSHIVEESRLAGKMTPIDKERLPHILRPSQPHKDTSYVQHPLSKRCYLLSKLKMPEPGTTSLTRSIVFTCLSSCKGEDGIGRRPIALMFCLFDKSGTLCGRRIIKLRICSAPQRDYHKEKADIDAGVMGRKRRISNPCTIMAQAPPHKRPSLNSSSQISSLKVPFSTSVRCVVTAAKPAAMVEDISSSQETVYSCAESDQKIHLREYIREVKWALSKKRSGNLTLQGYATDIYNSIRLTQAMCKNARDYDIRLKEKSEKSPDGGFHEVMGQDPD